MNWARDWDVLVWVAVALVLILLLGQCSRSKNRDARIFARASAYAMSVVAAIVMLFIAFGYYLAWYHRR